jgi:hypothetical protein
MKNQLPKNVTIFIGVVALVGLAVFLHKPKSQDE